VLAGGYTVVELTEEAVEKVTQRCRVSVAGCSAAVVMDRGPGEWVSDANALVQPAEDAVRSGIPRLGCDPFQVRKVALLDGPWLSGRTVVAEATRARCSPREELGYVPRHPVGELAPHWRRNGFAAWLFQRPRPAVTRARRPARRNPSRASRSLGRASVRVETPPAVAERASTSD
jgi:hypothetical protein